MRRASAAVLGAWFVALAADRVNLADGVVPFVLTPFLALTPFAIVSEWARRRMEGSRVAVARQEMQYATVCAVLLAVVWASVSVAQLPALSAARAALLTAQVASTWLIVVLARDRADLIALFGRASVVGIGLHLVASLAQMGTIFGIVPDAWRAGVVTVRLDAHTFGWIPRLTGLVIDPTRAGWTFLLLGWFVALGERRAGLRRTALAAAAVMVVATLSRSTLLGAATMLGLVALSRRPPRLRIRSLAAASIAAAVLGGALFFLPTDPAQGLSVLDPLAARLSSSEASASQHVLVIERGLEEATSSVQRFALGLGYGGAYAVLRDVFPGNPYANFHSLYVTMLAEAGVIALVCIVVLIGWPLARGGRWRPLIGGAAVLNVFYQTNAEPAFWLALALAWSLTERSERTSRPPD